MLSLLGSWWKKAERPAAGGAVATERPVLVREAFPRQRSESAEVTGYVETLERDRVRLWVKQRFEAGTVLRLELPAADGSTQPVLGCVVRLTPEATGEWIVECTFASELRDEDLRPLGAERLSPASADRRTWSRFRCEARARCRLVNEPSEAWSAPVVDISASGVGLWADRELEPGALLELELSAHGQSDSLTMLACVVRVAGRADGSWLAGCNFIRELTDRELADLT